MFTTIFIILEQFLYFSFVRNQEFKRQLTAKEELEHLNLYINEHNTKSRDILIEHNLRLVAHIAKKYESEKDLLEDLISIGTIGLIKAIDSYHIDKSTKLSTYASRCIENEILMHLRQHKKTSLDISLNEVLGFDKDGTEMTLMDIIPLQQREIPDHVHISFQIKQLQKYFYSLDAIFSFELNLMLLLLELVSCLSCNFCCKVINFLFHTFAYFETNYVLDYKSAVY